MMEKVSLQVGLEDAWQETHPGWRNSGERVSPLRTSVLPLPFDSPYVGLASWQMKKQRSGNVKELCPAHTAGHSRTILETRFPRVKPEPPHLMHIVDSEEREVVLFLLSRHNKHSYQG